MSRMSDQEVFELRGYLVVATNMPISVGDVLPGTNHEIDGHQPIETPLRVIVETDGADFDEQRSLYGMVPQIHHPGIKYLRVVAE